jgi:uncharacterized metal-binding protein YceD (DUF177 family)
MRKQALQPEIHRPVAIEKIGQAGFEQRIEANASELAVVAKRLDIPAVGALVGGFRLRRASGSAPGVIVAEGRLEARVTRVCVISLDEFETEVKLDFRVRFVPSALQSEDIDFEADDEIPYEGGEIDLGEAAVQELALALDPYPRKPGAELAADAADIPRSPFAALSRQRMN